MQRSFQQREIEVVPKQFVNQSDSELTRWFAN